MPTGIELTAKYPVLAFIVLLFKPVIEIDGQPIPGSWSKQMIPTTPGTHTVLVYFKYWFIYKANRATIQVNVPDGQTVQVLYKSRWAVFLPGKISVTSAS